MKETRLTVKDREYKLIMGRKELRYLEKKLHESPINAVLKCMSGIIPTSDYIVYSLHASMFKNHKDVTLSEVEQIIEDAQLEGKTLLDFCVVVIDIFINSNIIPKS